MKVVIFLFALFTAFPAFSQNEKPVVIAVIDTGFGTDEIKSAYGHLCKYGHKDFTGNNEFSTSFNTKVPVPVDHHGHGTNIVGLIERYAFNAKKPFCIVVLKYSDPKVKINAIQSETAAIQYATRIHADIINMSGGGTEPSKSETKAVKKYLDQGGTMVAAAGNDHMILSYIGSSYYPAMSDSRVIIVGNVDEEGNIAKTSNFGHLITRWENGNNREAYGLRMTGTSQATAVATGKIVGEKSFRHDRSKKIVAFRK